MDKEIRSRRATNGGMDDLFGTRPFLKNDCGARVTGAQMGIIRLPEPEA
jgi:hypothetical protein